MISEYYEMKLKSSTIFTGIYLIPYDIVHLVSARHRVSLVAYIWLV